MVKRIYTTILLIIFFVAIFIVGNQVVIQQFKNSSNKLLLEYNELYAIQDFKVTLLHFQNHFFEESLTSIHTEASDSLLIELKFKKDRIEELVTKKHLNEQWEELLGYYEVIDLPFRQGKRLPEYGIVNPFIEKILAILKSMIQETNLEIIETEYQNKMIQKHGSGTLLFFGILFIIIISFLSLNTAKDIAKPIKEFLNTFKRISSGEKHERVPVLAQDEFGILANEFNQLFDDLNETTVTLQYVRNIIDNIFGALFVCDENGHILSSNRIATKMLAYSQEELKGKHISGLFNWEDHSFSLENLDNGNKSKLVQKIKDTKEIITAEGLSIPVLNTCTHFQDKEESGLIVVAHDISDSVEYEKKLQDLQRKSLLAINETQERERSRIASDLHDGLGQQLSAISYTLQNLEIGKKDPGKIIYLQKLIDGAIKEVRSISHSLMPDVLRDFGLVPAIQEIVDHFNAIKEIEIDLNVYDLDERIDSKLENTLFRICQEALNNILKHSHAGQAVLQLFKSDDLITLTIEDDGVGFEVDWGEMDNKGIGLLSIRERVFALNGNFTVNTQRGKGTELIVEIPIV